MRIEELELVCQEAARNLVASQSVPGSPVPAAIVLPLPQATRVITLEGFPDDDPGRFDLLAAFARDTMRTANAACYGFLAEASAQADGEPVDVVVVAYGARRHRARITAAPLEAGAGENARALGAFTPSEDLDPTAMPFLSPLQHAADEATPEASEAGSGPLGGQGGGGLPIIGS